MQGQLPRISNSGVYEREGVIAYIRVLAHFFMGLILHLASVSALASTTGEGSAAPVDQATFEGQIKVASLPMDNASFLQFLRAEKRCYNHNRALPGDSCRDWLLSTLAALGRPSHAFLVESLNWYWSGKRRISADEVMQNRL